MRFFTLIFAVAMFLACEDGEFDMHRTEGDNYVIEDTDKRRFIDRNLAALPTPIPGTTDPAEWSNAVQEEIANVIEEFGTLNASASADRTSGWTQLLDTIFNDGNITSAAIDEVSAGKLSLGEINITNGTHTWIQDEERLRYIDTTDNSSTDFSPDGLWAATTPVGSGLDTAILRADSGLYAAETDDATGIADVATTQYGARGIKYTKRFGDLGGVGEEAVYRRESYSVSSPTWSSVTGGYAAPVAVDTGIPWDVSYTYAGGVTGVRCITQTATVGLVGGCMARIIKSGTDTIIIGSVQVISTEIPINQLIIIVEYDARDLPL